MVRPLPESLPLPRAALAEPLAVALHGIAVAGGVEGRTVLVSGSGPIGLLAAAACLAKGAAHVVSTDVVPSSLKLARALGVPETIDVSSAAVRTDSVDVALECSGATPGISVAIRATRPGGVVGQVGMVPGGPQPVVLAPYIAKELTLRGSFRFDDEIDEAIAILAERSNIDTVIGAVFGVRDVEEAFAVAKDPMRPGKVLVDMSK